MLDIHQNRRMATWWIRYPDLNWPNPDSLENVKKHAKELADANVTTVIMFGCHFRWDWLPWFNLINDYLAAVVEECHKYGMEVIDHFSVNLVHRTSTREEFVFSMKNSAPHLPLGPSREAAATWMYNGSYLNDFRMIDIVTGEPLYYPQYQGEGFCYRNPDFVEASVKYIKTLVAETHIDGLSADDPVHYMYFKSCGCKHCRAEFKKRTGMELPDANDTSFWFNYDNPAWPEWIKMKTEACGDYMARLRSELPEKFFLTSCGAASAAPAAGIGLCSDARQFLRGANYVNLEMSGNTPPYKHDPQTVNIDIPSKIATASHHLAAARETGARAFGTTYSHHPAASRICWALNKATGSDTWISTLKQRLGLPDHILDALPDEAELAKEVFTYEKEHEELFKGEIVSQAAIYFSYETRNKTLFGAFSRGYYADYREILFELSKLGISSHTVFSFPENAKQYPLVVVVSPLKMNEAEKKGLEAYLASGGKVIVCGPAEIEGCVSHYSIPNALNLPASEYNLQQLNAAWMKPLDWMTKTEIEPSGDKNEYTEIKPGLFYNPVRIRKNRDAVDQTVSLIKKYMVKMPFEVVSQKGYFINTFETEKEYFMHILAADYDTDINHELDEIRFHRSRVNIINKVEPCGVEQKIVIKSASLPEAFTPFFEHDADVKKDGENIIVTLPEKCAYTVLRFSK